MAEKAPQTIANHMRYDPWFHFFVIPVLLANFVMSAVVAVRHPGFLSVWTALFALALLTAASKIRLYALRVQDRLICLEQRLRLRDRLSHAQWAQIANLSERQLIALRFASDEELAALVEQTISVHLSPPAIKKAIRNWRADYFRV